ncbi:acyltransferase [Actinokineospora auranticolor]|uniref:Acyltransferase-like protein n=1 Tax=Actinokineospora auranticolor TaxID=155976 RepID=A0A2S6GEW3_9PSEU|nr:acyltransferase [Actinokineospora auranticolor]PPK63740.1 acyltransferase-like protein [Actinokineospora auranticolor]
MGAGTYVDPAADEPTVRLESPAAARSSGFRTDIQALRAVAEILRTGRVRLGRFYARRVRRLLPAAFLVLGVSLVAAYFLLPFQRWETNAQEAVASALYAENWLLAIHSVDYSAFTAVASLSQHYWSLSVEEQFYLCWPLLLLLLFKIRQRQAQIIGIAAVGLASLAFCVYFTDASKSQAYFVTPTRVWEFALGALIALGAPGSSCPGSRRAWRRSRAWC